MTPEELAVINAATLYREAQGRLDALQAEKQVKQGEIDALTLLIQSARNDVRTAKTALKAAAAALPNP